MKSPSDSFHLFDLLLTFPTQFVFPCLKRMAPAVKNSGMSEYELQRQKNLEENRRILESIRQEQVLSIFFVF